MTLREFMYNFRLKVLTEELKKLNEMTEKYIKQLEEEQGNESK